MSLKSPPPARNEKEQIKDLKDIRDEIDKQLREAQNTLEKGSDEETEKVQEFALSLEGLQKKITSLKGGLKNLEEQTEVQQDHLEKVSEKLKGVEALYAQKEANLKDTQEKLDKLINDREIFEELDGHLKSNIEEIRKQISQEETKLNDILGKSSSVIQEHDTLTTKNAALLEEFEHRTAELVNLDHGFLDLKEQTDTVKKEFLAREKDLTEMQKSLEIRRKYLEAVERKIATGQRTLRQLGVPIPDPSSIISLKPPEISHQRQHRHDLAQNIGITKKKFAYQAELEKPKADQTDMTEELEKAKNLLEAREKHLAQIEAKIATRAESLNSIQSQHTNLVEEITTFEGRSQNLKDSLALIETHIEERKTFLQELDEKVETNTATLKRIADKIEGNGAILKQEAIQLRESEKAYQQLRQDREKAATQYQTLCDKIKDSAEELEKLEQKKQTSDKMLKEADANLVVLRKQLGSMEKAIREGEIRIEEGMVLTRIRKVAKIYGGAVFIIGTLFFIIGLIGLISFSALPFAFLKNISIFLFIFCGILIFGSGLLHLST